MPKENPERIIDSPYTSPTTRGGSISIGTGGGGGGGGGGADNLDALSDVTLSAPANGQVLAYNSASGQWINSSAAAGVPNPHGLSSSYHSGTLNWPLINFAGSDMADLATRRHIDLQGMTPNDHHNQLHVLATGTALGPDHSISGAVDGQVLRASGPTTAALAVLHHTDLDNIGPDQHHFRVHGIIQGDNIGPVHTVSGPDFTVVGVHPADTLALLPTSSAPGAAVSILKTDANGGIQLDTNVLYVDGANNWVGVNRTPSGAALDVMASNNADHAQRIKQKTGQTGRLWRIEDVNGDELIVLDSVGNLQSGYSLVSGGPGFVSGLLGWRITPQGNAEFNNIWARGELHATVFVKDEVHATGGTFMVATAAILHDDAKIDSTAVDEDVLLIDSIPAGHGVPLQVQTTSGTFTGTELHVSFIGNLLNINDPPSGPAFYFQPGDIIRVKTEIAKPILPDTLRLADLWLEVNSAQQYDGYATYSIFKRSGSDCTIPKGTALVSYGKEGDGRILMTSDLQNAPYLDVFTVGPQVWTGNAGSSVPRVRLGRLDGVGLPGVSGVTQYGMIAGSDLSNANSGYFIASDKQFSLYKIDIRLNNGVTDTGLWTADGNLKIGSNVGTLASTGFQVITTGSRAGDVVIGNEASGNYLRWQQATGVLQVSGSLVTTDPGTTVTKTYVDNQDSSYDSLAQGYGTTAQTNSQLYSDARRIIGVSGTWTSPGTNQVSWASLAVVFASPVGSTRAIAAPGAPGYITIAARTYLYVSMAGTGTMTMATTTSIATVSAASNVLIAVCDPGDPAAPSAARLASVTVVAGSTYISGGNIFTGSITAGNIAAGTITADKLVSNSITVTQMAPAYTSTITTAQSTATSAQSTATSASTAASTAQSTANTANTAAGNAQTTANGAATAASNAQTAADNAAQAAADNLAYAQARRVMGVSGTWTVTDGDTIGWVSLQLKFANNSFRNISGNAAYTLTTPNFPNPTRHYLYVDATQTGTMTMLDTTSLGTLTVDSALIAVVDTGAQKATINIVAGSTYISGDNILTGSILAAHIFGRQITANQIATGTITANELAANSVTASEINVANLNAVSTQTGALNVDSSLTMATNGYIHSTGKTYGVSGGTGIFLGYDAGAYKFDVGSSSNFLRFDGTTVSVGANSLGVSNVNGSNLIALNASSPTGSATLSVVTNSLLGSGSALSVIPALEVQTSVKATRFSATSSIDTPTLTTPDLNLVDTTTGGANPRQMIQFSWSGHSNFFGYNSAGTLSYDGVMTVQSDLQANRLIVNGNTMQITTSRTPPSFGAPGNPGEICWDDNRLYVRTSSGWHFTPLSDVT